MNALNLISPLLIALLVGFVAIQKFGISDKDILDIFYGEKRRIYSSTSSTIKYKSNETHEGSDLSILETHLLILEELKKGVSNPFKISESIEIPVRYLMRSFIILVYQGLIDHENDENAFLREPVEINTGLKITEKGESVLSYFKEVENAIEGSMAPEFDNERFV